MNVTIDWMTSLIIVMDVLVRANQLQQEGVDVIHLELGGPDFEVPKCILESAIDVF